MDELKEAYYQLYRLKRELKNAYNYLKHVQPASISMNMQYSHCKYKIYDLLHYYPTLKRIKWEPVQK